MNKQQVKSSDVIIIGGGLAGLSAATYLARAGRSVRLFEQAKQFGGRAQTQQKKDFYFNLGPHALYRQGAGVAVLQELGIEFTGQVPNPKGYALKSGRTYRLPLDPASLLSTRLLSIAAKFELSRLLTAFPKLDPHPLQSTSVKTWLAQNVNHAEVRDVLESLFRLLTYTHDPAQQSMGAVVEQGQIAFAGSVYYLDEGWQTLVKGLRGAAAEAGTQLMSGAKVKAIDWNPGSGVQAVRLANGLTYAASAVIVATAPKTALKLINAPESTILREWCQRVSPVKAACLDVALPYLPNPKAKFALGVDSPLYFSVHSATAKLGPAGSALIHIAKYLKATDTTAINANQQELEAVLDLLQPGWRGIVIEQRFLPQITVAESVVTAASGGLAGRPGPQVPDIPGLYLAGDWVGAEGQLADAAFASAKQAAELVLANRPDVARSVDHAAVLQLSPERVAEFV